MDEQAPGQARLKLKLVNEQNRTGQHHVAIYLKYRRSSASRPITLLSYVSLSSLLHSYRWHLPCSL